MMSQAGHFEALLTAPSEKICVATQQRGAATQCAALPLRGQRHNCRRVKNTASGGVTTVVGAVIMVTCAAYATSSDAVDHGSRCTDPIPPSLWISASFVELLQLIAHVTHPRDQLCQKRDGICVDPPLCRGSSQG